MGGYSVERHISLESGRNVYEKLASSDKYDPFLVFLTEHNKKMRMLQIPINLILKDNVDDICEKVLNPSKKHNIVSETIKKVSSLTAQYLTSNVLDVEEILFEKIAERADAVFTALHGRPGEDGVVQKELKRVGLPFKRSRAQSAAITIDTYVTISRLRDAGFTVTSHRKVFKTEWAKDNHFTADKILNELNLSFIVKPVDDGCSADVMRVNKEDGCQDTCIYQNLRSITGIYFMAVMVLILMVFHS